MLCSHSQICSGCPLISIGFQEQQKQKEIRFLSLWNELFLTPPPALEWISVGEKGLRDRVDLTLSQGKLGFYDKTKSIFSVSECPQMSIALSKWFNDFKQYSFPIQKGSLRLRVSPTGLRGVWLDFANLDIKALFEEKNLLTKLLDDNVIVEIGQRRKRLIKKDGELKLLDPTKNEECFQTWTRTFAGEKEIQLSSLIGTFSQPGDLPNQKIAELIQKLVQQSDAKKIIEFGSGIGNLSFPAMGSDRSLTACEVDSLALAGFEKTLQQHPDFKSRISIHRGDFQNKNQISFKDFDLILVNPARSGLGNFLNTLSELKDEKRPKHLIYMSCYAESFLMDTAKISPLGYEPMKIYGLDQFPQTEHFEIISLWSLK